MFVVRDCDAMAASLTDYADAAPLSAMSAFGLGPLPSAAEEPTAALDSFRKSARGVSMAMETVGTTAALIVSALAALDGKATAEQFAFQTRDADPAEVDEALKRLDVVGIVRRSLRDELTLHDTVFDRHPDRPTSLGEPNALTSDVLAQICKKLRVEALPKKADRVAAIGGVFNDPQAADAIRKDLTRAASDLLDRIALVAGPCHIDPEDVGLASYQLRYSIPSASSNYRPANLDPEIQALIELTERGIVGIAGWESELWIWSEAWPLLDRPFRAVWPTVATPTTVPSRTSSARIPSFVAAFDQVLNAWEFEPPPVLKNGDHRIGKTQVRSTAKLLKIDADVVDLVGRLAIGMELLLPNVVAASGRGRRRRVDQAWMADAALMDAWRRADPPARCARLISEWCNPGEGCGQQLLVNRHVVIWELAKLDDAVGFGDAREFGRWIEHDRGPVGHAAAVAECVADLRALGVVEPSDPLALTSVGRMVLDDPTSLGGLSIGEATTAFVQADLTVIAPPDLRHDLATRLGSIADVESDSGAVVSRLSLDRITRAVQSGDDADSIIVFLSELSSVPLADTVTRLVHDAAERAGRVRVVSAPTVVIVGDPADLVTAISIKAAKLVKVSETVAISEVAPSKVRAALDRKGLAPELVLATTTSPSTPKRSSLDAARDAEQQAAEYRDMAERRGNKFLEQHAQSLTAQAERLADVDGRLKVTGFLAVTPAALAKLEPKQSAARQSAAKKPASKRTATKSAKRTPPNDPSPTT